MMMLMMIFCVLCVPKVPKVPKKKTAMGFGETIYSKTKSAGYSRRETQCN
jgi:hypothetical protein